jgi:hypothetical protein
VVVGYTFDITIPDGSLYLNLPEGDSCIRPDRDL